MCLITALDIPGCRKGKYTSNVLANGVIFSTLKHADPHTLRGRSTLKVGKLVSVHFETSRSANSIAKKSNDLANVLPESNQKSHELSLIRKCGQIVTTDNKRTFTNFLSADKDIMNHDPI